MARRDSFKGLLEQLGQTHALLEDENQTLHREVAKRRAELRGHGAKPAAANGLRGVAGLVEPYGQAAYGQMWPKDPPPLVSLNGVEEVVDADAGGRVPREAWACLPRQLLDPKALESGAEPTEDSGGSVARLGRRNTRKDSTADAQQLVNKRRLERFQEMFKVKKASKDFKVNAVKLQVLLRSRGMQDLDIEQVGRWLAAVSAAHAKMRGGAEPKGQKALDVEMSLEHFVAAIHVPDLPARVSSEEKGVRKLQARLLRQNLEEVIAKVSRSEKFETSEGEDSVDSERSPEPPSERLRRHTGTIVNFAATVAVLISLACLFLSPDNNPNSPVWTSVEILCTVVFVAEIAIKHWLLGSSGYWCGADRQWNWLDAVITAISVCDVTVQIAAATKVQNHDVAAGRLTAALRVFRLLRLARGLRMLRSPLVRELSNMLIGLLLGAPALFWVIFLLGGVVLLIGLLLRIAIGPSYGAEQLIDRCGHGDSPTDDDGCYPHLLFAEEYCNTVTRCSFTVFRCIIGDCSSKGGQSLPGHFSRGFGMRFDAAYCLGMIVLIFGLFNVITAIFVEATMAGLKYNEVKQKLQLKYESEYVSKKLRELVKTAHTVFRALPEDPNRMPLTSTRTLDLSTDTLADIALEERDFFAVLEHSKIKVILSELDVDLDGTAPDILFEIMDTSNDGRIQLSEMIYCLMRLRGGPMKVDMIAPGLQLRHMKEEVQELKQMIKGIPRK